MKNRSESQTRFYLALALVLLVALTVRIAAAYQWQSQQASVESFAWGDSKTYWQIAENLSEHGDYSFGSPPKRIFRSPGYCGFLALEMMASQAILGKPLSVMAARISGCILGVLAVAAVAIWIKSKTNRNSVALLTAVGLAFYPGAIAMSIFVLSEALFLPVAVLALWTWDQALSESKLHSKLSWSAISGLLSGQAVLIRPSWLLFPPFAALVLLLFYSQRSKNFLSSLTIGIMMGVAMSPWWYRNYELTGQFIPTTLQVGASLYDGWNPNANGSSDMTHGYVIEEAVRAQVATSARFASLTDDEMALQQELAANEALRQAARKWGYDNPTKLAELFFVKVYKTWRPWPVAAEAGSWKTQTLVGGYLVLILLFATPCFFLVSRSTTWFLLFLPTVYFTLLHGVFVGSIRYRQPAVFLLVPFAAFGVWQLLQRTKFITNYFEDKINE